MSLINRYNVLLFSGLVVLLFVMGHMFLLRQALLCAGQCDISEMFFAEQRDKA